MKKVIYLICSTLIITINVMAQTWYFGNAAGIKFSHSSGWSTIPAPNTPLLTMANVSTNEGCSVTNDVNGNVLLFTDGKYVWDAIGNKVNTGAGSPVMLTGNSSATQSGLIIPVPNPAPNNKCFEKYFVFGVPDIGTYSSDVSGRCRPNDGVSYTIVTYNSGNGTWLASAVARIYKDALGDSIKAVTEKITAIGDVNHGYWVLFHGFYNFSSTNASTSCRTPPILANDNLIGKKFFAIQISPTNTGTVSAPVVSSVEPMISREREHTTFLGNGSQGQLKFSKDGTKVAMVTAFAHQIYVYGFNSSSGHVTSVLFFKDHFTSTANNLAPEYGVEFSPNGQYLYVSYQTNTYATTGKISRIDLTTSPYPETDYFSSSTIRYGELQRGPDDNIYVAETNAAIGKISNTEAALPILSTQAITGQCIFGLPTLVSNEMICGQATGGGTQTGTTTQTFNPCCPPLDTAKLKEMLVYHGSGSIAADYTVNFQPTPAFEAQMQAYFNYIKVACNTSITNLVINWRLSDQGNGPTPSPGYGPASDDPAFTWWNTSTNPLGAPVISPSPFFSIPNPFPMHVNEWYLVHTGTYIEPAGISCFSGCPPAELYIRLQVQVGIARNAGVLQFSDGKKIIKTVPIK